MLQKNTNHTFKAGRILLQRTTIHSPDLEPFTYEEAIVDIDITCLKLSNLFAKEHIHFLKNLFKVSDKDITAWTVEQGSAIISTVSDPRNKKRGMVEEEEDLNQHEPAMEKSWIMLCDSCRKMKQTTPHVSPRDGKIVVDGNYCQACFPVKKSRN